MHFNLAVMAEAQGKLGTAVTEYKAFQPFATPDESLVAEQRIVELDGRRRKIAGAYKQKIAVGAITMWRVVPIRGRSAAAWPAARHSPAVENWYRTQVFPNLMSRFVTFGYSQHRTRRG